MAKQQTLFVGGPNLALKIPSREFDAVLRFYRDALQLPQLNDYLPSVVFEFGPVLLWLDKVDTMTQVELWLELRTPDTQAAAKHLAQHKVVRRDEVEKLPDEFDGFWIAGPGNLIHLVHGNKENL